MLLLLLLLFIALGCAQQTSSEPWSQAFIDNMQLTRQCLPTALTDLMEEWFTQLIDPPQYNLLFAQALDAIGFRVRARHGLCHALERALVRVTDSLDYQAQQGGATPEMKSAHGWTATLAHMRAQRVTFLARCHAVAPRETVETKKSLIKCVNRVRKTAMRAFVVEKFP